MRHAAVSGVVVLGLVAAGCGSDAGVITASDPVVVAMCDAATASTTDEAVAAFERDHDLLHGLARELQDMDERAPAGRLLEAKQVVEADIADDVPSGRLFRDLATLLDATLAGYEVADGSGPLTCEQETD